MQHACMHMTEAAPAPRADRGLLRRGPAQARPRPRLQIVPRQALVGDRVPRDPQEEGGQRLPVHGARPLVRHRRAAHQRRHRHRGGTDYL